jgi:hypothetical protein
MRSLLRSATVVALVMCAATSEALATSRHRHHHHPAAQKVTPAANAMPNAVPTPPARPAPPPTNAQPTKPGEIGNTEPSAVVVDTQDALPILGKSVRSAAGEDMGRLVDVVVDRDGDPRAAIIDFGGFLGVGSRKIAVDWKALHFSPDDPKGDVIRLELTRDQVKAAPEYKQGSPVVVLGAMGSLQKMPFTHPKMQEN